MDPNHKAAFGTFGTFGRSASMPLLPRDMDQKLEVDLGPRKQQEWTHTLRDIIESPQYQLLLANTTTSHNPGFYLPRSLNALMGDSEDQDCDGSEYMSSPRSDVTVKPALSQKGRVASYFDSPIPSSPPSFTAGSPLSSDHGLYNPVRMLGPLATTFESQRQTSANILPKSVSEPHLGSYLRAADRQSHLDQFPTSPRKDCQNFSIETGGSYRDQGINKMGALKGGFITRPNGHRRRISTRISSIPSIPSPLGPGHFMDDLGSDNSGLVSSPHSRRQNFISTGSQPAAVMDQLSTPHRPPTSIRQIMKLENMFGSNVPFDPNDPFVEPRFTHQPTKSTYAHYRPKAQTPVTPPRSRIFSQSDGAPGIRSCGNLPIPPPPLPFTRGHSSTPHNPQERHHREIVRENWIREEACKIVNLTRAAYLAKQKYQATNTREDFEMCRRAQEDLTNALSLDKRMEERRNMFLPHRALRTGPGCLPADGFGGSTIDAVGSDGQGKLLGYDMALMERICAQVVSKNRREKGFVGGDMFRQGKRELRRRVIGGIGVATKMRK